MHKLTRKTVAVPLAAGLILLSAATVTARHEANTPDEATAADVAEQLAENHARVVSALEDAADQLAETPANAAAADALGNVIDMLTNDAIGLTKAADAASGDHPGAENHPN